MEFNNKQRKFTIQDLISLCHHDILEPNDPTLFYNRAFEKNTPIVNNNY